MQYQSLFQQLNCQLTIVFLFEDFSVNQIVFNSFMRLELYKKTQNLFKDVFIGLDVTDQEFVFLCIRLFITFNQREFDFCWCRFQRCVFWLLKFDQTDVQKYRKLQVQRIECEILFESFLILNEPTQVLQKVFEIIFFQESLTDHVSNMWIFLMAFVLCQNVSCCFELASLES